mgnify:CR=1 FL=1
MFKNTTRRAVIYSVVYAILFITVVILAIVLILGENGSGNEKTAVGCILSGGRDDTGWNSDNYRGIVDACADSGVELRVIEHVPEERDACVEAIRRLASEGCRIIFLTSYGYAEYASGIAGEYPSVIFCANSSDFTADNMIYCFARMYQGRYLAGIAAGLTTKTGITGYVAAMPNNEVNRGIDAFTLGVRSVNPSAKVLVKFTGSWDAPADEETAVEALAERSADVMTYHQNGDTVPRTCERLGVDLIGYHRVQEDIGGSMLTSVSCDWRRLYGLVLRDNLTGSGAFTNDSWLGLNEMTILVPEPSGNADSRAASAIAEAKERIITGKDVFSDTIYDNTGVLRCDEGETLSDRTLLTGMDWYAEGVEIIE